MYAVYRGPVGLKPSPNAFTIAQPSYWQKVQEQLGCKLAHKSAFDTLQVITGARTDAMLQKALHKGIRPAQALSRQHCPYLWTKPPRDDIEAIGLALLKAAKPCPTGRLFEKARDSLIPQACDAPVRTSHTLCSIDITSETGMLRYIRQLSDKDLALDIAA